MTPLLDSVKDNASILELIEFAGQLGALLSYVQLIDLPESQLPRRITVSQTVFEPSVRRTDDLQRNALGRKRRKN
jgi:hypothetical protein|tara:strand:- start:348 stop:572 length:225 start_codon:yes stop_codon:yes gene_type:complete